MIGETPVPLTLGNASGTIEMLVSTRLHPRIKTRYQKETERATKALTLVDRRFGAMPGPVVALSRRGETG